LLRHRTGHLLAGFASRGLIANTDVAIAHDGYPSLEGELRQRGTNKEVARSSAESARPIFRFKARLAFAARAVLFFAQGTVKNPPRRVEPEGSCGRLTCDGDWRNRMRALSYLIALAFVLTGPSLAGSADRDMPGVGTFTYCGSPIMTPSQGATALIGH
jgi:hypothetical protein